MLKRVRLFVSLVILGFLACVKSAVRLIMGTLVESNEEKSDLGQLDDSGCVQDDSLQNKMAESEEHRVNLLDLSDDVLLYILRHCTPRDLKALGFSCARLGRLVRERSLWRRVDARSESCSVSRLKWYIQHALHSDTRILYIRGYAEESRGCLGLLNCSRKEAEEAQKNHRAQKAQRQNGQEAAPTLRAANLSRHHACLYISAHSSSRLPRFRGSPLWEDEDTCRPGHNACAGPRFTISEPVLRQLRDRCVRLSRLALEHCNIDCSTTNLAYLPSTLTRLSLCGTKCFNLPIDKSFLFKIQDHLPLLESLDVSECSWLEPSSLLPLSKHSKLKELYMRDCHKLAEFVAYASLSSRYGFRKLQVLDLRGSPVSDSEVSPLAWLPELRQLRLAARVRRPPQRHAHYADDAAVRRPDLLPWELQEPDYFKNANGDDRADGDRDALRSDNDSAGDDDDGDDGDDKDDNAGRVAQSDAPETPNEGESSKTGLPNEGESSKTGLPNEGESRKTGQESPRKKRKAENGSGDATVNGEQSKKRKKSSKKRHKSDKADNKDSEEDRYEKRRCQTIVIVDRRTYADDESDDEDLRLNRLEAYRQGQMMARHAAQAPRYDDPGFSGGEPSGISVQVQNNENQIAGSQAKKEEANAKTDELKASEKKEAKTEEGVKKDGEIKPEVKGQVSGEDTVEEKLESQIENANKPSTSKSETDAQKVNVETENLKQIDLSCNNESKDDVNQGASTSKDNVPNDNKNENNTRTERYIRFRQGQQPVIVNVNRTQRPANPVPGNFPANGHGRPLYPPRRMRVNYDRETGQNVLDVEHRNVHYSIRHEEINNQRIYNVEVESRVFDRNQHGGQRENPEEQEDLHVRMFEQARNMERNNRNIMRLIRHAEPGNPYPDFQPIPAVQHQVFQQLANYNPVGDADNAGLPVLEDNREREPRHRVLYVNVGQPANSIGPLPNVLQGMADNRILNLHRSHLDPSSLVTDSAVRRFGRAANNEIRFVLVGIPQPFLGPNDGSSRPERSSLRVLVMNGYSNITDRSLVHLATAAPYLQHLDVRETSVTPEGVENFRSLRPDCEVLFSPYVERNVDWSDEDD